MAKRKEKNEPKHDEPTEPTEGSAVAPGGTDTGPEDEGLPELDDLSEPPPAVAARPTAADLAELEAHLTDEEFDAMAQIRARRLGGGRIVKGGRVLSHTGRYKVLRQIKYKAPGSDAPMRAKPGDYVRLSKEDAALLMRTKKNHAGVTSTPAVEPELV